MEDRRDRRLDTWIETGRQFVDGVSGRRPGQRRSSFDLDSVGRWVGDKVEWLLEEDDAWREPWQDTDRPLRSGKRPLEAISRRGRQVASAPSVTAMTSPDPVSVDDWPEDGSGEGLTAVLPRSDRSALIATLDQVSHQENAA